MRQFRRQVANIAQRLGRPDGDHVIEPFAGFEWITVTIPPHERDAEFGDKLKGEWSGSPALSI